MSPSLSSCAPIESFLSSVDTNVLQDESVRISLPDGWEKDERLHDNAMIQASNVEQDLYVIVLADDQEALSQYPLEDNSETYRSLLIQGLENVEDPARMEIDSINGNDAVQYEIRAQIGDAKITYLHTTVLTDSRYYQVVAWTTTEQYAVHKSVLQNMVKSFREIEPVS